MAPHLGGTVSKPDVKASRLVEALERKRKQLDLEIEEFQAKKDEEYRIFERDLRDVSLEDDQQRRWSDSGQSLQERGRPQKRGSGLNEAIQKNGRAGKLEDGFGGHGVEGQARNSYLSDVPNVQNDPTLGPFLTEHEREEEFRGLFTPAYLPLLEGTPKEQRRGSREALLAPLFKSNGPSITNHDIAQGFSSSATLPISSANTSLPPPPARPLAASAPHREDLLERRDSSIGSRRSSMRDPRTPRSPKRVLFSIDDVVVSPSTSPVAQRSSKGPSSHAAGTPDGSSTSQANDETRNSNYQGYHVMDWTKNLSTKSENYGSPGVPFAVPNGRPSVFTTLNQPQQASNASPLTGGEEFEHVNGEDELFTFDEDINMGDSDDEKDNGEGNLGSDEEEDSKDGMLGSSPHAGSLPIEIRWPVRHASGN